jgi:hypothetical protein
MASKRVMLTALVALAASAPGAARAIESFQTPEAAADALVAAAKSPGSGGFTTIFGEEGAALLSTGDSAADARNLADFLELAAESRSVVEAADGEKTLAFGKIDWQFPIPLKQDNAGWQFDVVAGREAISNATIGENELVAIGACADYVAAQTEYFQSLHDEEPVQQFAKRLVSSDGLHDGLYWPPEEPTDRSPLGDRIVAAAVAPGLDGGPGSYHGYQFRILTRQGAAAPGGAYDYRLNGRMLAGHALIAWPAIYGETGIMTFLCDQRGVVYERNFGPDTNNVAPAIRTFNPNPSWSVIVP